MRDERLNNQGYIETYAVYGFNLDNQRKNRLIYTKEPMAFIKAMIMNNVVVDTSQSAGVFLHDSTSVVIKTADKIAIKTNYMLVNVETNEKYIVVSVSRNQQISRFRGRYDRDRSMIQFVSLRGA